MSSNRIRYKKIKDGTILESVQKFISEAGIPYRVTIDLNDYTYKIRNLNSDNIIKGGDNINNLNVLKRKVKDHLLKLGVSFEAESRNRTFGLVSKGYTQKKHEELGN